MIRCRLEDVVKSTGAELLRGDPNSKLHGVSTDTRTIEELTLFVSLSGPNFDGNQFAVAAAEGGAGALLLAGDAESIADILAELPADIPVLCHADPRRALSDLAAWHRSRLDIPVVGITGSCGKTTTKNILCELLNSVRRVVGSPSSFNNDIGVPHTLFLAEESTEVLVVEMGTNSPGEISALCRTTRPNGAILTNVGASHLEGLHSIAGVAEEKGALISCLPPEGFCVLNADCLWTPRLRSLTGSKVITFSVDGDGDLDATDVWFHSAGTTFKLEGREVTFPLLGLHNLQNLLAALAACRGLGIDLEQVLPHVSNIAGGRRRLEKKILGKMTLLDDTYNANPDSAKASVRVLAGIHGHDRRILVLGDMLELGDLAAESHHSVGVLGAQSGLDLLILIGELTRATAAGALEGGLLAEQIIHFASLNEALVEIPGLLADGDLVLIKGSRRMGLERLVAALEKECANSGHDSNGTNADRSLSTSGG
ncbi:MAG: UDP-N-acetylmuramoyl-tripeptide--D-alanyl-D-alanine ligase [Planctomycetota bacterium]|jgi:UDP-N-acetylmuramoyl-tripeptide--D-alanyl-D-alanine ligase